MGKYLVYRDAYITIFHDDQKYMIVFVNDQGDSKVVPYDDNFYTVEENIIAYVELINRSFRGYNSVEKKEHIRKYIKHIERQLGGEVNWEYLEASGVEK